MWINPDTLAVYRTHAEIRSAWPQVLLPSAMTDEIVASLGLLPVLQTLPPGFDPALQIAEEAAPALIDGHWTQQWHLRDITAEERKARVPTVVTMRQARLALLQAGLLDQMETAISAIEDPDQRQAVQIEWEYAAEVSREHPWVQSLATALRLNETQLDDLFVAASKL